MNSNEEVIIIICTTYYLLLYYLLIEMHVFFIHSYKHTSISSIDMW